MGSFAHHRREEDRSLNPLRRVSLQARAARQADVGQLLSHLTRSTLRRIERLHSHPCDLPPPSSTEPPRSPTPRRIPISLFPPRPIRPPTTPISNTLPRAPTSKPSPPSQTSPRDTSVLVPAANDLLPLVPPPRTIELPAPPRPGNHSVLVKISPSFIILSREPRGLLSTTADLPHRTDLPPALGAVERVRGMGAVEGGGGLNEGWTEELESAARSGNSGEELVGPW